MSVMAPPPAEQRGVSWSSCGHMTHDSSALHLIQKPNSRKHFTPPTTIPVAPFKSSFSLLYLFMKWFDFSFSTTELVESLYLCVLVQHNDADVQSKSFVKLLLTRFQMKINTVSRHFALCSFKTVDK